MHLRRQGKLHYNYRRDYDPAIGRYIESDPIGLDGGLNTYLYADADPILKIDPTGESAAGTAAGIGLGIRVCMRIPACKKAVQEAIKKQGRVLQVRASHSPSLLSEVGVVRTLLAYLLDQGTEGASAVPQSMAVSGSLQQSAFW